jgi:hypothetical protein
LSFKLPDVLQRLECATPRKLYSLAWSLSDAKGLFIYSSANFTGFSERTRRRWAARFVRWSLWEIVDAGGGRGNHPIYRIKGKTDFLKKQMRENERQQDQNKPGHEAKDVKGIKPPFGKPCAGDKNSKRLKWLNDRNKRWTYSFDGWQTLEQGQYGYDKLARCLRYCFWELGAPRSVNDGITGILLNKLEGLPVERCKEACFKLLRWVSQTIEKFRRLMTKGRALFAWVAWLLSKFLIGETPEPLKSAQTASPEQQFYRRITALQAWLVEREKEFEEKQTCGTCKRVHSQVEHDSGFTDDGNRKWNCMGWARMKLAALEDELHELQKRKERAAAQRSYLRLKSIDELASTTRRLTVQDVAQRFGLAISQVKRLARALGVTPTPAAMKMGVIDELPRSPLSSE